MAEGQNQSMDVDDPCAKVAKWWLEPTENNQEIDIKVPVEDDFDVRPSYTLDDFLFYDEDGELTAFDLDSDKLNEQNVFAAGVLRQDADGSFIPARFLSNAEVKDLKIGPITKWAADQDSKERPVLVVSSLKGHYILKKPHHLYTSFMTSALKKALAINVAIKYLFSGFDGKATVAGLAAAFKHHNLELKDYKELIVEQVSLFDNGSTLQKLSDLPCIKILKGEPVFPIRSFVVSENREAEKKSEECDKPVERKKPKPVKVFRSSSQNSNFNKCATSHEVAFSRATTTVLVRELFEECFKQQINYESNEKVVKSKEKRCGSCENCLNDQPCLQQKGSNVSNIDDKENSSVLNTDQEIKECVIKLEKMKPDFKTVSAKWVDEPTEGQSGVSCYQSVDMFGEIFSVGDFAQLNNGKIGRIFGLFEKSGQKSAHFQEFVLGKDTVLGETSDPRELFEIYKCSDIPLSAISGKADVHYWPVPDNWKWIGGTKDSLEVPPVDANSPNSFFYRLRYNDNWVRFETASTKDDDATARCVSCHAKQELNLDGMIRPVDCMNPNAFALSLKKWKGFVYEDGVKHMIGDAVYFNAKSSSSLGGINPKVFKKDDDSKDEEIDLSDETKYPEAYRKTDYVKGSNDATVSPFDIGIITEVFSPVGSFSNQNLRIKVRLLYRPHQLACLTGQQQFDKDFNLLYWSEDFKTVEAVNVRGKCFVLPRKSIDQDILEWTSSGSNRFYFEEAYDKSDNEVIELNEQASNYSVEGNHGALPKVEEPLRALDVFAGCGGLSSGLKQVGVSEAHWAIEVYEPAAQAYKMNEPNCSVFTDDCNALLRMVMDDGATRHQNQDLPQKGEVDLLCGGPPCQGFSGMNRFNSGEYSQFKNSLISTYLSVSEALSRKI